MTSSLEIEIISGQNICFFVYALFVNLSSRPCGCILRSQAEILYDRNYKRSFDFTAFRSRWQKNSM